MSREHYPVLRIGQTAVITLPAEIDITNADQVREDLLWVLNQGAVLLIADLSKTTFCDSAGVSALVRSFRRAEASGSQMHLVVSTSPVQAGAGPYRRGSPAEYFSERDRGASGPE